MKILSYQVSKIAFVMAFVSATGSQPALAQVAPESEDQQAQPAPDANAASDSPKDDLHSRQIDYQGNIIVSAQGLEQLDLLAGTSVYEADDIQRNLAGQLGDLLAKLPGVSASGFAPGASRPVLRGFQGERVRILIDGIGTSDVSNTSADHATTIDPLTTERIEVLRGPAVLLFGSQAIGGAVNVIDKRIPTRVPDEAIHIDALAAVDSASNLRTGGASVDVPVTSSLVLHVDGSYRESDDLEISGFQIAPALRSEILALAAEEEAEGELEEAAELREAANQRGIIPNSASRTWTVNGGFGLILGESTFGASIGYYDTRYGVPCSPRHRARARRGGRRRGRGRGGGERLHRARTVSRRFSRRYRFGQRLFRTAETARGIFRLHPHRIRGQRSRHGIRERKHRSAR